MSPHRSSTLSSIPNDDEACAALLAFANVGDSMSSKNTGISTRHKNYRISEKRKRCSRNERTHTKTRIIGERKKRRDIGDQHSTVFPISKIATVMKRVLPSGATISKEAKQAVQACVFEFICFLTSEACDSGGQKVSSSRKLGADDILKAFCHLGMEKYAELCKPFIERYRTHIGDKFNGNNDAVGISTTNNSALSIPLCTTSNEAALSPSAPGDVRVLIPHTTREQQMLPSPPQISCTHKVSNVDDTLHSSPLVVTAREVSSPPPPPPSVAAATTAITATAATTAVATATAASESVDSAVVLAASQLALHQQQMVVVPPNTPVTPFITPLSPNVHALKTLKAASLEVATSLVYAWSRPIVESALRLAGSPLTTPTTPYASPILSPAMSPMFLARNATTSLPLLPPSLLQPKLETLGSTARSSSHHHHHHVINQFDSIRAPSSINTRNEALTTPQTSIFGCLRPTPSCDASSSHEHTSTTPTSTAFRSSGVVIATAEINNDSFNT